MKFGIESFAVWRAGAESPKPDVSFIPPLARRRLTPLERAALHAAHAAAPDGPRCPVVFASRWGEIGVTFDLMRQFRDEGEMSPAGFSNSVHNAAPGAWSLLTGNTAAYTAIAARARSLEAGLLEAIAQLAAPGPDLAAARALLFVYAEEATPAFYRPAFPAPEEGRALAALLSADGADCAAAFRAADEPPLAFDAVADFLSGARATLPAEHFEVTRL